jgi:AcrR family transcriptional regulator
MGLKTRRSESKRSEILLAARQLFAEEDYQHVTLRRLAERLECSPTAIYLYFKDKHELVMELVVEGFELLTQSIRDAGQGLEPVEKLRATSLAYLRFGLENSHYYRLMFQLQDPLLKELCWQNEQRVSRQCFAHLVSIIAEIRASGRLALPQDDLLVAHVHWAGLHGAVSLALNDMLKRLEPDQHEKFFSTLVHNLVRSITF